MFVLQIGITAGNILKYMDKAATIELSQLFLYLEEPPEIILMSVGWLVREGYVILDKKNGDNYVISLRRDAHKEIDGEKYQGIQ